MSATLVALPVSASTPAGATAVQAFDGGGFTSFSNVVALLSNTGVSDSGVTYSGTYPGVLNVRLVLGYNNPLTSNQSLDGLWIQTAHTYWHDVGWFYPVRIVGYRGAETHTLSFPVAIPPRWAPGSGVDFLNYHNFPVFFPPVPQTTKTPDGTLWQDCDRFEVEWAIHAAGIVLPPNNQVTYAWGTGSTPPHQARLGFASLMFTYTEKAVVTGITPASTTSTSPRPTVSWSLTASQQAQSSYRIVVVPTGTIDSAGVTAGSSTFNPDLAETISWDSGRVRSEAKSAIIGESLPDGGYYTYIQAWTPASQGEIPGRWSNSTPWTVDAENINLPALSVVNHSATYTVQITVSPAAPVGGYLNAHTYEIQVFDDDLDEWVALVNLASLPGGGTTTVFYDSAKKPGATASYRARSRYIRGDSLVAVTQWVTATTAVTDRNEWWLRVVADRTLNRSLSSTSSLVVESWQPARGRPQSVSWGVGASFPVVTQDVLKAATMTMTVWALGGTAYTDLRALLDHGGDMVLVSPWRETWKVRVGGEFQEEHVRVSPRSGETGPLGFVRKVSFTLIEVG